MYSAVNYVKCFEGCKPHVKMCLCVCAHFWVKVKAGKHLLACDCDACCSMLLSPIDSTSPALEKISLLKKVKVVVVDVKVLRIRWSTCPFLKLFTFAEHSLSIAPLSCCFASIAE